MEFISGFSKIQKNMYYKENIANQITSINKEVFLNVCITSSGFTISISISRISYTVHSKFDHLGLSVFSHQPTWVLASLCRMTL